MDGAVKEAGKAEENGKIEEEKDEDLVNPKPFNKVHYKNAKMNLQNGESEKMPPLTAAAEIDQSLTSPDVNLVEIPVDWSSMKSFSSDFDLAEVEPELKKLKQWVAKEFSLVTNSPSPPRSPRRSPPPNVPASVINFGPFSPADSDLSWSPESRKKLPIRLKIKGTKQPLAPDSKPEPWRKRRLLGPYRNTYLRPRPANSPTIYACESAPNTSMGPPQSRIRRTPYETVKKALNYLKGELEIFIHRPPEPEVADLEHLSDFEIWQRQNAPPRELPAYSISRVTQDSFFSVEEVIMELDMFLNSISDTTSSDGMKARLLEFQLRLGLPEWPSFYNLMWKSAKEFMYYLAEHFVYDSSSYDAECINGGEGFGHSDGGGEGFDHSDGGGEGQSDGGGEGQSDGGGEGQSDGAEGRR